MPDPHFFALVLAVVVIAVGTAYHQRWMNHSPTPWDESVSRAKRLLRRETSHETDEISPGDDLEDADGEADEWWGYIDRSGDTRRVYANRPVDLGELTELEQWVLRRQQDGAGSEEIARGVEEEFGYSRATAYRVMSRLKDRS